MGSHSVTRHRHRRHAAARHRHVHLDGHAAANTAPVVDTVTITPAVPTTDQTLTAKVTSHDAEGDTLTTSYQWTRNGTDIAGATAARSISPPPATATGAISSGCARPSTTAASRARPSPRAPMTVANSAPVFSTNFADRTDTVGDTPSLDADATDADAADTLTYSATGLPSWHHHQLDHGRHHAAPSSRAAWAATPSAST